MKTKEVTCYECKKSGQIKSECPKLKFKNKGAKDKRKAFKATWDNSSEFEMEEEQDEVANLCFMALEDDIEVPSSSNSSFNFNDDLNDYCHDIDDDDDDDDDETSLVSKLMSKCKSLFSRKNHYKHELTSLTKEFEILKNEHSSLTTSHDKLRMI